MVSPHLRDPYWSVRIPRKYQPLYSCLKTVQRSRVPRLSGKWVYGAAARCLANIPGIYCTLVNTQESGSALVTCSGGKIPPLFSETYHRALALIRAPRLLATAPELQLLFRLPLLPLCTSMLLVTLLINFLSKRKVLLSVNLESLIWDISLLIKPEVRKFL